MLSRFSIRDQITLFAGILGILLVGATAGLAMYLAKNREAAVASDKMVALAHSMAESLDTGLAERSREIAIIADLEVLRPDWLSDPAAIRGVLDDLQASLPDYAWIGFARADGTVMAATEGLLEGKDVGERPWFAQGLRGPMVGDVHEAKLLANLLRPRANGEPFRFVDVASPVRDAAGQVIGVLGAHLSWSWAEDLRRSLRESHLATESTDLWVLSAEGSVLLGPATGVESFTPIEAAAMLRAGSGQYREDGPAGPTLVGFSVATGDERFQSLNWIVLAREPSHIAFSTARARVAKIATMGLSVAVLGLFLFALIGGKLAQPMRVLTKEMDQIGREASMDMLPWVRGSREVERLSGALRSLLRRIGDAERKTAESEHQRAIDERRYSEDVEQLRLLADTDPLSGLLNRRSFNRSAGEAMEHFSRHRRAFGVLVVDIDHFKKVNDTHGHAAGDEVIQHVANLLRHVVRTPDRVARIGGEEFVALIHEVSAEDLETLAERIRNEVAQAYICRDRLIIKITVSIGGSMVVGNERDVEDIVARADAALYRAKAEGRNRVVMNLEGDVTAVADAA